jgi:acetyl-CoA carboxylase biotin carboxyl carrier protein
MSGDIDLPLTPDDVAAVIAALDGCAYDTLEMTTPRFTLKLARSGSGGWTQEWRREAADRQPAVASAAAVASPETDGMLAIRPPLPGTFYLAPQPGAPPFVSVGDLVEADTVVGIIETMKVMNSVPAGVAGEIAMIVAANGEMVDQDAILMRVRPAAATR